MGGREFVLAAGLRVVDALAPRLFPGWSRDPPSLRPARPGVAILIPERGTPARLGACLAAVEAACAPIAEPVSVIVVVNGSDRRDYRTLVARHPMAQWHFEARPLGFAGAIARGLGHVAHDWVYLLNSDMTIAADALATLLPLRDARTFAIASQIFLEDAARRREETGWTDYRIDRRVTQHYDRTPEGGAVRGHLYAGGGASLFRTALLRRYAATTGAYAPFYFEDADWGVQAARDGFAVKFCPASTVRHAHRATIAQFYAPAEIARIVRRNQLLFEARHGFGGAARLLAGEPARTRRELNSLRTLLTIFRQRWSTRRARSRGYAPELCCATFHLRPFRADRSTVLVDGRARPGATRRQRERVGATVQALASSANVVLVVVDRGDGAIASGLDAATVVHVVGGRAADSGRRGDARHDEALRFARQLEWWRRTYRASFVVCAVEPAPSLPELRRQASGSDGHFPTTVARV